MIKRGLMAAAIVALLGTFVLIYLGSPAHIVEAHLQQPDTVLVGQVFEVILTVRNTTDTEQEIVSVGIEQALLDHGLQIIEMVPGYRSVDDRDRWQEYIFSRRLRPLLAPDDSMPLTLRLVATHPGTYKGEIALWYDNRIRSDYVMLQIGAEAHPSPWLGH